jgi:hypothetical protein
MAFQKEKSEVMESLQARLKKCKDIQDPQRKRRALANLQVLLKQFNDMETEILHGLWLVSNHQKIEFFKINPQYVEEWAIKNYALWSEIPRTYLEDVFNNHETRHAVFCEKNKMTHQEGTMHKSRNRGTITDLSKMETGYVAYGKNISPKITMAAHPKMVALIPQNLGWQEVMAEFEKRERLSIHVKVAKVLEKIHHPKECNLLLFKKDIPTALEEYAVKELFVLRKETEMIRAAAESNCKLWIVDPVEAGDISEKLDKDFSGMIGVRYFAL